MSFRCPVCQCAALAVTHGISLLPDGRSDEILVQLVSCVGCGMAGYQESRCGALDQEAWEHSGYCIAQADLDESKSLLQCPAPLDAGCRCQAHAELQNWLGQNSNAFMSAKDFQMIWIP